MKKVFIGILVLALVAIFGVSQALAAESGTIAVTVTISSVIDISVSPTSWAIGNLAESGVTDTTGGGGDYFTVTNNSNAAINLTTTVGNTSSEHWAFANDPGIESFAMDQSINQGTSWTEIDATGGATLVSGLAPHTNQSFDLQFHAPIQTAHGGILETFNVTITGSTP